MGNHIDTQQPTTMHHSHKEDDCSTDSMDQNESYVKITRPMSIPIVLTLSADNASEVLSAVADTMVHILEKDLKTCGIAIPWEDIQSSMRKGPIGSCSGCPKCGTST